MTRSPIRFGPELYVQASQAVGEVAFIAPRPLYGLLAYGPQPAWRLSEEGVDELVHALVTDQLGTLATADLALARRRVPCNAAAVNDASLALAILLTDKAMWQLPVALPTTLQPAPQP